MYLWERVLHVGLVGGVEAEGGAREGRAARGGMESDKSLAQSFHRKILSDMLFHTICWETHREGGGCILPDDRCTNIR